MDWAFVAKVLISQFSFTHSGIHHYSLKQRNKCTDSFIPTTLTIFVHLGAAALDGPDEARSIGPEEKLPPIVFNGIHLLTTDYSTVRTLRNIVASCRRAKRDIVFINTSNEFMRLFQRVDEEVQMEQISTTADRTGLTLAHPDGSDRISIASEGLAISDSIQPALSYSSVDFPGTGTLPEDFVAKT